MEAPPPIRRESAPPQVQPHPQGISRELPVWNSCCFALQSPRRGKGEAEGKGMVSPPNQPMDPKRATATVVLAFGFSGLDAACVSVR